MPKVIQGQPGSAMILEWETLVAGPALAGAVVVERRGLMTLLVGVGALIVALLVGYFILHIILPFLLHLIAHLVTLVFMLLIGGAVVFLLMLAYARLFG